MAFDPITAVSEFGGKLIDKFFPDAGEKERNNIEAFLTTFTAQAKIISTEAASQHWLAANWRPITMLTFVGLIVARMFGYTAEGISEAEYIELWGLIKIGLGGYVVSRSVEKVAPSFLGRNK